MERLCKIIVLIILLFCAISYFRQDYEFIKDEGTIYRFNTRNGEVYRHNIKYFKDYWEKTTNN